MKRIAFILALISAVPSIYGQNAEDALRYSQTNVVGTTRFTSMGGAFGALGGDFSVISTNPAGLAVYRKSEFTISPAVFTQKSIADYNNTSREDYKLNFNLANAGIVIANVMQPYGDAKGWVSRSFSFGYNRINNFNSHVTIEGNNSTSSLLDVYLQNALNGGSPKTPGDLDPFGSQVAYNAYLIDDTTGTGNYFSQIPSGTSLVQRKTIATTGSMGETYFAFSGNYSNKLYMGGSLGISSLRYTQTSTYEELTDLNDTNLILDSYKLNEELKTRGSGVNLKVGFIYKITDWVRMGAAVHTPTYYNMSDNWSNNITANYRTGFDTTSKSPSGSFNYTLTTPAKVIGSLAFIINKYALLSADYELVDYASARLGAKTESFFDQNSVIQNNLKPAGNFRVGAEVKLNPFSIRAGYNYQGNPYKNSSLDGSRNNYSFGVGIREDSYFLDFGYVLSTYAGTHYFYDPTLVNSANINNTSNNFMMTVGLKF